LRVPYLYIFIFNSMSFGIVDNMRNAAFFRDVLDSISNSGTCDQAQTSLRVYAPVPGLVYARCLLTVLDSMTTKPESNSGRPDLCAAVGTQHMQVTERRQQGRVCSCALEAGPLFTPATHASHTCLYVAVDRDTPQNRPACMLLAGTLSYSTVSNMQIWDRHPCHECKKKIDEDVRINCVTTHCSRYYAKSRAT